MSYIGSLDQGTTSTRFIIFNNLGEIVGQHQIEHQQLLPKSGWVEHDASEIWRNTHNVIEKALLNSGLKVSDLAAIGITNQRETVVAWDRANGEPLANAIVWQDTRSADYLNNFNDADKSTITSKTGTPIAPYFSASKMAWLLANGVQPSPTLAFGTIDA